MIKKRPLTEQEETRIHEALKDHSAEEVAKMFNRGRTLIFRLKKKKKSKLSVVNTALQQASENSLTAALKMLVEQLAGQGVETVCIDVKKRLCSVVVKKTIDFEV